MEKIEIIMGKFKLHTDKNGKTYIMDIDTKKKLDLTNPTDLRILINLLNDYYDIVKGKWII